MSVETFLAEDQEPEEIRLRHHQVEVPEAIVRGLTLRLGQSAPAGCG
ncbi:hypothetical protein ACIGZJ_34655 [Kitasatospora sp. NPDC052868]